MTMPATFFARAFAHRGLHDASVAENSMAAFRGTISLVWELPSTLSVLQAHSLLLQRGRPKWASLAAPPLGRRSACGKLLSHSHSCRLLLAHDEFVVSNTEGGWSQGHDPIALLVQTSAENGFWIGGRAVFDGARAHPR